MAAITPDFLKRVLAREHAAVVEFVAILSPIFQFRVGKLLRRRWPLSNRDLRQECLDLCQEAFVELFKDDGRIIGNWDRARGLSFENFAGLVAERLAADRLRGRTERLFHEGEMEQEEQEETAIEQGRTPERIVGSRELLKALLDRLQAELTDLGRLVFDLVFLEQRDVDEVCVILNMKQDAVYQWRSRLRERVKVIAAELESGP